MSDPVPAARSGARRRRPALIAVGAVVTVVFSYLAVRGVSWSGVRQALGSAHLVWLAPALVLMAIAVVMRGMRWRYLYDPATRPGVWPILEATVIGYFFNTILPARAGEAARVVAINRRASTSRAEALATVGVDRLWDVGVLLALLAASLDQRRHVAWTGAAEVLAVVLLVLWIGLVAVLVAFGDRPALWAARRLNRLPGLHRAPLEQAAVRMVSGLGALHRPRLVAGALFWTVTSWSVLAGSTWCVLAAFHLNLGPMAGVLVVVTTGLSMAIPAGPAGVGVFEAAVLVGLSPFGVPKAEGLSAALVLHALNIVPFLVAGAIVLHFHARSGNGAPTATTAPPRPAAPRSRAGV
jgi:uncharacterized protein (TIRG00374 family)